MLEPWWSATTTKGDAEAEVRIEDGTSLTVNINFQASLADLVDALKVQSQAAVNTLLLHSIGISGSFVLYVGGQAICVGEELRIGRDGSILVTSYRIVNQQAAAVETTVNGAAMTLSLFFSLLTEGLKLAQAMQGAPSGDALALHPQLQDTLTQSAASAATNAGKARPNIVGNVLRNKLEPQLTAKLREAIRGNLLKFSQVDLTGLFELPADLH